MQTCQASGLGKRDCNNDIPLLDMSMRYIPITFSESPSTKEIDEWGVKKREGGGKKKGKPGKRQCMRTTDIDTSYTCPYHALPRTGFLILPPNFPPNLKALPQTIRRPRGRPSHECLCCFSVRTRGYSLSSCRIEFASSLTSAQSEIMQTRTPWQISSGSRSGLNVKRKYFLIYPSRSLADADFTHPATAMCMRQIRGDLISSV
jgi:hypothetical protein